MGKTDRVVLTMGVALSWLLTAIGLGGCASGGAASRSVRTSVRVEPAAAASTQRTASPDGISVVPDTAPPPPPTLGQLQGRSGSQAALSPAPGKRIRELTVPEGTPLSTALARVAAEAGLSLYIDPSVRGTTGAHVRNVTVDQAVRELVSRSGSEATVQLQGQILRVVPVRMETRTFRLDYVALSRVGTMSTVVQRRLSNTLGSSPQLGTATGLSPAAGGVVGGIAGVSGGDVVQAQSAANIWQEIRIALVGIMQAGQPASRATGGQPGAVEPANAGAGQTTGGVSGSEAASIPFPDGSSLVISPISGLINVTAMPDKLAAVEAFIKDFQASVLRQVLIEAKIVEVSLTDSFQYGIDWSIVSTAAKGKFGVTLRSAPTVQTTGNAGNVNFTLTGGSTQINAVLTALASQGTVNVLSNEKTTALNNQRAIFDVTTDEVFFSVTQTPLFGPTGAVISTQSSIIPQQIAVGVVLDVLPQISADNVLTMDIRPAVTTIDHVDSITVPNGPTSSTSATAPVIARREGDTIARLRAGETMIIGGLVQTRRDHTMSGIPGLRDLPLIGKAFQHISDTNTRSELVVFLTPTIISGQPAAGSSGGP